MGDATMRKFESDFLSRTIAIYRIFESVRDSREFDYFFQLSSKGIGMCPTSEKRLGSRFTRKVMLDRYVLTI